MKIKNNFLFTLLAVTIAASIGLGAYIFKTYSVLNKNITSVELVLGNDFDKSAIPITYIVDGEDEYIDFKTPYRYINIKDSLYSSIFEEEAKPRRIRLYFDKPSENLAIYSIKIKSQNKVRDVNLKDIKIIEGLKLYKVKDKYSVDTQGKHSFIELPEAYIYTSDFVNLYLLIFPLIILIFLMALVIKNLKPVNFKPVSVQNITISFFILSIFLPAPIYNVALILMVISNLKSLSWKALKSQKTNLLILGLFFCYLLNNIIISEESFNELSTIERFLPFFVLGVMLPSIAKRNSLGLFPVSAFLIGFWLLLTSIFDVYIHQNYEFLSFNFFAKYLHPVYFSYLLFFSICYVNLNYKGKQRYILEFVLFLFLIFSGSKLVFLFSLMVVFINFIKNKRTILLILPLLFVVVLFSPLKNRFSDILKKEDMTILNQKQIDNPNDSRINGLTLRLILWREALATMHGGDYIFGKGVTKETNNHLKRRLDKLGLKNHISFNPHNQYIDTLWRTGFLGFLILISIPLYCFKKGIQRKDVLLIQFSLFFTAVMLSESVFGRVRGIFFFITIVLILINTSELNENSNIRNSRNTK